MTEDSKVIKIREDFPILSTSVYGERLVYLDNAATNQISHDVSDAMTRHLLTENANTHRGGHFLGQRATVALEQARNEVAAFIGAKDSDCICFNCGTTAGINIVALGFERLMSASGSVLVTSMEHHSNFLPWQQLCLRTGADFRVAPLTQEGDVDLEKFEHLLSDESVKIAAFAHTSNVTGAVNPVAQMTEIAHRHGARVLIDAAQGVRSGRIDFGAIDCDFLCFSAHKMTGPTGVGVLCGKKSALSKLEISSFGGGMVDSVYDKTSEFSDLPFRFEAGTPNAAGIAGLRAAVAYLNKTDTQWIAGRERLLTAYLRDCLSQIDGVRLLGRPENQIGAVSFTVKNRHPYDLSGIMDKHGIALRVGHHCAIPCLRHFGEEAVIRISPAFYNQYKEIDEAVASLERAIHFFNKWD